MYVVPAAFDLFKPGAVDSEDMTLHSSLVDLVGETEFKVTKQAITKPTEIRPPSETLSFMGEYATPARPLRLNQ